MTALTLRSSSEGATRNLGRLLGRALRPGVAVLLRGDLGAGKTVLVRGVGDELGAKGVRSPSFTLVNEYRTPALLLVHADLYRLDAGGADALGLEEYAGLPDAALLVEWPDRWSFPPREDVLDVRIEALDEGTRRLSLSAAGAGAEGVLRALAEAARTGCPGVEAAGWEGNQ